MNNPKKENGQSSSGSSADQIKNERNQSQHDDAMNMIRRSLFDDPPEEDLTPAAPVEGNNKPEPSSWARESLFDDEDEADSGSPVVPENYQAQGQYTYEEPPQQPTATPNSSTKGDYKGLRNLALEDYVEPTVKAPSMPITDDKELRPSEKIMLGVLALILAIVVFMGVSYFAKSSASVQPPAPTETAEVKTPVPNNLELPGGWQFNLNKGKIDNGKWNPQGPEWVQGSEYCKLVSLPWNIQLEAVVKTFQAGDIIKVSYTNGENAFYEINSIQQVPVVEKLTETQSCLLVVLSQTEAEQRWVVSATIVDK